MRRLKLLAAVAVAALYYATPTTARLYPTRFKNVTWDDTNWRLKTTYADQGHYQARSTLSNGYLGIALAALGPFFEVDEPVNGDIINGWPLFDRHQTFATIAGFWDEQPTTNGTNFEWLNQYGGESTISGIPHWAGIYLECNGQFLKASTDLSQIQNFSSTWDFRRGLMHWTYTWDAPGCSSLEIEYKTFVHKRQVHKAATQLKVTASKDTNITIHNVLDGDCAVRSGLVSKGSEGNTIYSSVHPLNLPHSEAFIYSTIVSNGLNARNWTDSTSQVFGSSTNASSISQSNTASLSKNKPFVACKYIGGASSDQISHPRSVARNESLHGAQTGWKKLLASHSAEWAFIMKPDTVDSFHYANGTLPENEHLIELQINAITNPYQILQNTVSTHALEAAGNNKALVSNGIPVSGWGSDSYAGMVFWDQEIWMLPGLVLTFPEDMQTVPNYRQARYKQAIDNVQTSFTGSQNHTTFSPGAAIYSWTSSRYGNCTGTGPCWDYEYHINGDIALALEGTYLTTGDVKKFEIDHLPIYESVATVYSNLLAYNDTTKTWILTNATDPDEFANNVNNPGYTMALIQHVLNQANYYKSLSNASINTHWGLQAENIEIPESSSAGIHLEFTGMNGSIQVKQADVILLYDLLNFQSPYRLKDLDFYAGRQSLDGPGMTYAVFSIVAAIASPSGCSSYSYALWANEPYARAPWFQYSEQLIDDFSLNGGFHPAYPFLTAMGGQARVAIFAYLGYHLLSSSSLNVDPSLPPQIPRIEYRIFYWRGWGIKATSNQTHTIIKRSTHRLSTADPQYASNGTNMPIPVTLGTNSTVYPLTFKQPLILATRRPGANKTIPGNIAQCSHATSSSPHLPGQFPLSAIDGAISTKWQPVNASSNSSLTVHLGSSGIVPIIGFAFDWAQAPPQSWTISFSNTSSAHHAGHGSSSKGGKDAGEEVDDLVVASQDHVVVNNPYNPQTVDKVMPYSSNTTAYTLPAPVWGGLFATLTMKGNQGDDGTGQGATVAEWAIIAQMGKGESKNEVELRRYFEDDFGFK